MAHVADDRYGSSPSRGSGDPAPLFGDERPGGLWSRLKAPHVEQTGTEERGLLIICRVSR